MKKLISTLNTNNVSDAIRSKMNFTIKQPITQETTNIVQKINYDVSNQLFVLRGIGVIYDNTDINNYILDFTDEEDAFLIALTYF